MVTTSGVEIRYRQKDKLIQRERSYLLGFQRDKPKYLLATFPTNISLRSCSDPAFHCVCQWAAATAMAMATRKGRKG